MTDSKASSKNMLDYGKQLDDVAGNAVEASRTITLDVGECKAIAVKFKLTWDSTTILTFVSYGSMDAGTTYQQIQAQSVAAGTGTLTDFSAVKGTAGSPLSGDTGVILDYTTACYDYFKMVITGTSAAAADKFNAWAKGTLV